MSIQANNLSSVCTTCVSKHYTTKQKGYSRVPLWLLWWFHRAKSNRQMLVTTNRCIPLRTTIGWSAVVSCEGKLILLCESEFPVVFYLVRAVHRTDSRIVINWKPNEWWPKGGDRNSCFWQDIFSLQASLRYNGPLTHSVMTKDLLLPNDQFKSYGKVFSMCVHGNVRLAHRKQSACFHPEYEITFTCPLAPSTVRIIESTITYRGKR